MSIGDLSGVVLQHIGIGSLQHARRSAVKPRGMLAQFRTAPSGFHTDELHIGIGEEVIKDAHRVGTAAYTGDNGVRKSAFAGEDLLARLATDAAMEIANHC